MMKIRRFDLRENAGAFIAVTVVWLAANVAAAFLLNFPRAEEARSLRAASEDFELKLRRRQEKVNAVRSDFERVMGSARSLQTFYDDVLSTKRQRMTTFQKEIRDIAAKFNIKPESISYTRDVNKGEQLVKFSAILPLSGSYENLRAFVNSLENSENFLVIQSVALTDSKEGGVILSLQISVATYFLDPDLRLRTAGAQRGG